MRKTISIVALLVSALLAAPVVSAQAQTRSAHSRDHANPRALKKHHAPRVSRPRQAEIACTVAGCAPVPRGCHQEPGYTFDGEPTAFAVILCP